MSMEVDEFNFLLLLAALFIIVGIFLGSLFIPMPNSDGIEIEQKKIQNNININRCYRAGGIAITDGETLINCIKL